jgi:hypothetical protein
MTTEFAPKQRAGAAIPGTEDLATSGSGPAPAADAWPSEQLEALRQQAAQERGGLAMRAYVNELEFELREALRLVPKAEDLKEIMIEFGELRHDLEGLSAMVGRDAADAGKWRLIEAAKATLGVYPASVVGGEHSYVKRSDYMEGWNAAIVAIRAAMSAVEEAYGSLDEDDRVKLAQLVHGGVVYWGVDRGEQTAKPWVLARDTFAFASTDGEYLPPEEIARLHRVWIEYSRDGVAAWLVLHRDEPPLPDIITDRYMKAIASLVQEGL